MPEHTTFLHYLLSLLPLRENAENLGKSFIGGHTVEYRGLEPFFMALTVVVLIVALAVWARSTYRKLKLAVQPEDKLTVRTFFEVFFGFFYDLASESMGPKNAKRYFPIIGSSAIFIFVSNALALVPGFSPPTSSLNITFGCALLVFILFNYYGIKENGWAYFKHLAGPNPYIAPLMVIIETISLCVRPFTLAMRLMLNMAVDHMLVAIFLGLFALFLPIPLFFLGIIVILVQTMVFCLLTIVYIGLATERQEGHEAH
jgi:F-type H+-transporting ATPase subunit a